MSLICNINNRGLSINPCGTLHLVELRICMIYKIKLFSIIQIIFEDIHVGMYSLTFPAFSPKIGNE